MDAVSKVKWKIKELLIQKDMTIYELANKAEITDACIRNWYTKRNYNPSLVAIIKVCNALDVSVAELFREEDDEMVCVGTEERRLLSNWAILNDKQKKVVKTLMETFTEK
ncbi:MAG: helix-turn-helix transcriptional regulator [Clostridia bacterium]|nr:helix-turn-helix transcriptional regulator [Clostridia bacterium]